MIFCVLIVTLLSIITSKAKISVFILFFISKSKSQKESKMAYFGCQIDCFRFDSFVIPQPCFLISHKKISKGDLVFCKACIPSPRGKYMIHPLGSTDILHTPSNDLLYRWYSLATGFADSRLT